MDDVKESLTPLNRPGGFKITDRAISFCSFQPDARILDLGCGSGATVDHLRQQYGLDALGIDIAPDSSGNWPHCAQASAEAIPYPSGSMDGIIMECSFSLMNTQEVVLQECSRVLKNKGMLIISDMYALGEPMQLTGCLGRLETRDAIVSRLESAGFRLGLFEDYSHDLRSMWGQMIFDTGAEAFFCSLGVDPGMLKRIKCGYYLWVGSKISL
jgi:arsenite methyltransferase